MRIRLHAVLVLALLVCQSAFSFPEPQSIQTHGQWTLNVRYSQPQQINVHIPGDAEGKTRRFWYIILTVTNNTSQDVPFYPAFYLSTDTYQVIPSEKRLRNVVFEQIKLVNQGRYPFLESLDFVGNTILQGTDNTRDIVVIWPDFDPNAKNVDLLFGGLSNETAVIDHPTEKEEDGTAKKVVLSKTLLLKYSIGGDPTMRAYAKLKPIGREWVMR